MRVSFQKYFVVGLLLSSSLGSVVARADVLSSVPTGTVVQTIEVQGNQRIESATVVAYLNVKVGDVLSADKVDESLKALFKTNFFADVSIQTHGSKLIVSVVENPVINEIAFEGNKKLNDDILFQEVGLKSRQVYTKEAVLNAQNRIIDIYKRKGRFSAVVTPKIIKRDHNRVDLVFEVDEANLTAVRKISFQGNERYSNSSLRSVLQTKETKWYRFFSSDDTYDPDRLKYDQELLRQHYLENGYVDFKVLATTAELSRDRDNFYINFTVEEGERYKVGKVEIKNNLPKLKMELFKDCIEVESGNWYSIKDVEKTINRLNDEIGNHGYAFVEVQPDATKNEKDKTIDLVFSIKEGPRVYINRIDIDGNMATVDKVIRREFRLKEGDAFSTNKLKRSEERIHNLGYFSKVEIKKEATKYPDRVDIKTTVEEQSTGELMFAAALSSLDGLGGQIKYSESNLLGFGTELSAQLYVSTRFSEYNISYTDPWFLDKELQAGFDLFRSSQDLGQQSSYSHKQFGIAPRIGYHLTEYLTQSWRYTIRNDRITDILPEASRAIKQQQGEATTSMISHGLLYDRRDNVRDPSRGCFIRLSNDFAGLGGQVHFIRHELSVGKYFSLADEWILGLKSKAGTVHSYQGKQIRISDRFMLGGYSLRGFEYGGIGPRDKTQSDGLGGRHVYTGTAELIFPLGLPKELGIKGEVFSDFGDVWSSGEDKTQVFDEQFTRVSCGFGITWTSPLGPIRLDFTKALRKKRYDRTQIFLFSFSTRT